MRGADIVMEVLLEQGVANVFGYPGAAVLELYDALYTHRSHICHTLTIHEQGAAHAADGYARASGKTGVVIATSGPGATNLVTGLAAAYMDSTPLVCITGNVRRDRIGRDSFQEVYTAGITLPITKHNFVVREIEKLADTLRAAFRIAESGRKGPVLVDIPRDISQAEGEFISQVKKQEPTPTLDQNAIAQVAEQIARAERPLLLYGGGAANASAQLRCLIESGFPACHTLMGTGLANDLGMIGMHGRASVNRAVAECDLLLAVGTRFSDRVALDFKNFAPKATRIQIDIDPSEKNKNVRMDTFLLGDAGTVLAALADAIQSVNCPVWHETLAVWQKQDPAGDVLPQAMMETIARVGGADAIWTTDVGQHQLWAAMSGMRCYPRTFLTSGGLGAMGFGYGAAIGAQRAHPDATVLHLTGDASFHMNLAECATAVRYGLPIVSIVFNNNALGLVRQYQHQICADRFSESLPGWKTDFAAVARGFGAVGYHAGTPEELRQALSQAIAARLPAVIECRIDPALQALPYDKDAPLD